MIEKPRIRVKTFKIDGIDVTGRADQTVLDVAIENGIDIPRLCYMEGLKSIGACRLCLVEIEGQRGLISACTARISEGMSVLTKTDRLLKYRRQILELLFSERNHQCAVCVSNGHCELQNMAISVGLTHVDIAYLNPKLNIDASHRRFLNDPNRCILCNRCVRVCDEIEGAHTWDLLGRGVDTRVVTDLDEHWGISESCTGCGKCVHVCPTGALSEKGVSVAEMAKRRNFLPYLKSNRGIS
ncbi:MAG: bidirectional hydrogenase complex protein HoxU [Campylobacterales bacterium]|nr:bidirectional hydrogenase complex protein HoxU [Campylobacterales bacterium]